jgi:hypothetical protein
LSDFVTRNGSGELAVLRGMLAFRVDEGEVICRGDGEHEGELECEQNEVDRESETDIWMLTPKRMVVHEADPYSCDNPFDGGQCMSRRWVGDWADGWVDGCRLGVDESSAG